MDIWVLEANGMAWNISSESTAAGKIAKFVEAAITHDEDGNSIVPDPDTVAVEVTTEELKTHAWRLPKARIDRIENLRIKRDAKLDKIDDELKDNLIGRPGANRTKENSADEKQALRDMPVKATAALAKMKNTDNMEAYLPVELK